MGEVVSHYCLGSRFTDDQERGAFLISSCQQQVFNASPFLPAAQRVSGCATTSLLYLNIPGTFACFEYMYYSSAWGFSEWRAGLCVYNVLVNPAPSTENLNHGPSFLTLFCNERKNLINAGILLLDYLCCALSCRLSFIYLFFLQDPAK